MRLLTKNFAHSQSRASQRSLALVALNTRLSDFVLVRLTIVTTQVYATHVPYRVAGFQQRAFSFIFIARNSAGFLLRVAFSQRFVFISVCLSVCLSLSLSLCLFLSLFVIISVLFPVSLCLSVFSLCLSLLFCVFISFFLLLIVFSLSLLVSFSLY